MKLLWKYIRRTLSAYPVFSLLLGCIIFLQTFLFLSSNDRTFNFRGPPVSMRILHQLTKEELRSSSFGCTNRDINRTEALIYQAPIRQNVKLIIGVPTVNRTGDSYILNTMRSLVDNINDDEKKSVLILVFLADFQNSTRSVIATELWKNFQEHISEGFIQVIRAPPSFYPSSEINRHLHGKDAMYNQWRTKQNFDYAFIMKYAMGKSTYYMQLEDDVITTPGYVTSIYEYIESQTEWICLEFSELGFIGKLYRTEDIGKLAEVMVMFNSKQPADYLFLYYNRIMEQNQRFIKRPTLFQHMGLYSSLSGKLQRLKDKYFDRYEKEYNGDNPPADVITSMQTYMTFLPKMAYLKTEGLFWSHGSPKSGDTFTVIFEQPQNLKRVVVITGSKYHPDDHIYNGRLDASLTLFKTKDGMKCANNIELGTFLNGTLNVSNINESNKYSVMCLVITVTENQSQWLIIKEIAVFTE